MTQLNLERTLRAQLDVLNDIIDRKIVRGLSYTREAREHKQILYRLSNLKRSRSNWSFRSFSLA